MFVMTNVCSVAVCLSLCGGLCSCEYMFMCSMSHFRPVSHRGVISILCERPFACFQVRCFISFIHLPPLPSPHPLLILPRKADYYNAVNRFVIMNILYRKLKVE